MKQQNNSEFIQQELNTVKSEIQQLKQRNLEKDQNKAWETSMLRRFLIALFTYLVMILVMWSIGVDHPEINAIIPTLGFVLSTFSLSFIRGVWEKNQI